MNNSILQFCFKLSHLIFLLSRGGRYGTWGRRWKCSHGQCRFPLDLVLDDDGDEDQDDGDQIIIICISILVVTAWGNTKRPLETYFPFLWFQQKPHENEDHYNMIWWFSLWWLSYQWHYFSQVIIGVIKSVAQDNEDRYLAGLFFFIKLFARNLKRDFFINISNNLAQDPERLVA